MKDALLCIDFWNVGQGDCSVITLPSGELIIIDVGPRGSPLVEWLREGHRQDLRIAAIVVTHNDADHIGSLPAIIREFKSRISTIWMLVDRPKNDAKFQKLFRIVADGENQGAYKILRLEAGHQIWHHAVSKTEIRVLHPTMSQNLLATDSNSTCGLIVLESNGRTLVVWPGDLELRMTAKHLGGVRPSVLFGPHHGGPTDYPSRAVRRRNRAEHNHRHTQQVISAAQALAPKVNFISVATRNNYSHPRPGFLRLMGRQNACVVCTQLTTSCDRRRVLAERPVFEGAGALGLRAPKTGVSCRGAMRVFVCEGEVHLDQFMSAHFEAVQQLAHPRCRQKQSPDFELSW